MFLGQLKASLFFKVGATGAILSLIVIYYQSQLYNHQPPFPHQYISKVAQHYPQYVVFRLSTVTGAALILLGWLTNHFFLQTIARDSGINLKKYHIQIPLLLGLTGGMMLMGNTATIDTGIMNEHAHEFFARNFFILTFLAQIYNTVICTLLHRKTQLVGKYNLYAKYFVLVLLLVQLVDGTVKEYLMGVESDKNKFLEWTMTATVVSMFISIGMDVNKYDFVFVDVQQQANIQMEAQRQNRYTYQ